MKGIHNRDNDYEDQKDILYSQRYFTEDELLENLAEINPAWGDAFLYEAQIEKL